MTPALDVHAHVQPDIPPSELTALSAHVVAVTRAPEEYEQTLSRKDATTTWALGCHPGLTLPHRHFNARGFAAHARTAAVVGEIGLDAHSRVPLEVQVETLKAILDVLATVPRVSSHHSAGATDRLIDLLAHRAIQGVILHWWRGTPEQTQAAVDLGCYFSINSTEFRDPRVVGRVPRDRILTETDHPFGDKREKAPRRPGRMDRTVAALGEAWGTNAQDVRSQVWRNWRTLCLSTESVELIPESFYVEMMST